MADELFKEVDDVVKFGKWLLLKLPTGKRCGSCPCLEKVPAGPCDPRAEGYLCMPLQTSLLHGEEGVYKAYGCPVKPTDVEYMKL